MKLDKAWFNVGTKPNPRMKEMVRNAHMVLKGACVVEYGTYDIEKAKLLTITVKRRASGVAATARKIGCHPNHLSYILHGQRVPNDTLRRRLARLGITTTVDGKEFEEAR